jgi:hypothetical protein
MLVSERDLEVKDLFTVALEPKVSGLDDPGVHGSHGHFVDFIPLDAKEVGNPDGRRASVHLRPRLGSPRMGRVEAHGFEPRMARGFDTELLGDLALEEVYLRAFRRQGRKRSHRSRRAGDVDRRREVIEKDGRQAQVAVRFVASEVGANAPSGGDTLDDGSPKLLERKPGKRPTLHGLVVSEGEKAGRMDHG